MFLKKVNSELLGFAAAISKSGSTSLWDKGKAVRRDVILQGDGIPTQHNLLRWDERSFFIDSEYMLESLDMQDVTVGMSLPNHRKRPMVKIVKQENEWTSYE